MADDAPVAIRLLGGFVVTVGDKLVTADAWRLRKAKTVVKLLALADGHRLHRDALIAVLWADRDAVSARNNLHQTLYVARRALAGAAGGLLSLRDDVVLLSDDAAPWLDTDAFDAACRTARHTQDPGDYQRAAALYRGDLLPEDRFEDWADGAREALRERHLGLLVEYAEVLSARDEHAQVVDLVSRVTAVDPFHEGAQRLLMASLAASGRRYEALAVFDRLREALTEEYNAVPGPQTSRLYRRLLAAEVPTTPAESPPGGRVDRSPAAAAAHGTQALRLEHTSFIGRRREIAEITQALHRARLVTLTGPGGAGKTRLGCQVAFGLSGVYPDGVHVAELAALTRPELVAQAVAALLDVPLPEGGVAEIALARQLTERRLLLVLDNCEHLLEACARLAAELLHTCPAVVLLATSREPLRVGGEVVWRTPSLALPDLRALPAMARLAELESVQLFLARARDAAPGFVLDATTAPAVAEICVRLDGMPLALELAAARTSALHPRQIATRLDDALHVLDRGSRSALTRQQTLHATITWSHDLLEEQERVLFRRLSVFAGGLVLEAAESVGGGPGLDVVDLLSRLVDKSLVHVEQAGGSARYRLLETIRQYADQRLRQAGEKPACVRAHREWYLAFAEAHDPERAVGVVNDTPRAVAAEYDNVRAALASGLTDDPPVALRLAVSMWRFWLARGEFAEGTRWLSATLAAAPDRTSTRARGLLAAAAMEVRRGNPTRFLEALAGEAVAIMREVGSEQALAETLQLAGFLSWITDDGWSRAVDLIQQGRALASSAGDVGLVANGTHLLGVIALLRGSHRQAEAHFVEVLRLLDGLPPDRAPFFTAVAHAVSWEPGRDGKPPRMLFTETLMLFRRVGSGPAVASTLSNLSYVKRLQGDLLQAEAMLQGSLDAFLRHADLHGQGLALCHLANLRRVCGQLPEAAALLDRSLVLRRDLGDRRGTGMVLVNQGLVAADAGQLAQADRLLREALLLFEDMEDGPGRWGTLLNLGLVLLDAGQDERARRVLQQWRELPVVSWCFRGRAWALVSLAALERRFGDHAAAGRCEDEANRRLVALDDEPGLAYLAAVK